ncbi:heat-inducible transcriptional repressor HrcA [Desulfuribacillus stibiiarsenatis]|uniref:Heat-inducible transcription repressor HrcA n=1 Tax=Desulfuribacillus stibiiarsenatis TaxID=1390249 RepID=A0A1E5L824_9FIRM|nr:heat-inducible transcriptional repressor HrcA [Desulfuribacillus stibiiarsenatis]OEH86139.1 heat-inducible transcriptional repressor HrcA [Desulfuribacillus stibiiarsenatis]
MLTDRQKLILKTIIDDYVRSAEPVGSRIIAKKDKINYSSATIRNEMSDLEELGYLEQPHTSAGRVPSQKGYRFYVDYLIEPTTMNHVEIENVRDILFKRKAEAEEVIRNTANILADLTNYTSIVLGPEVFKAKLRSIQLIPISQASCVAIVVTDTGHVENKVVAIPPDLPIYELEKLTKILNAKLQGVPLYKLSQSIYNEVLVELRKNMEQFEHAMEFVEGIVTQTTHQKDNRDFFLRGTTHILNQPEFKDIDTVRKFFNLFEQNGVIVDLFSNQTSSIEVKIGQENQVEDAKNCTIITANYVINGKPIGSIGVIGPTRLDYPKLITLIDYVAKDLSQALNQLNKE